MDAKTVGGAFLSAFLQVLFDRLAPNEIPKLFGRKKPIADLLDELKTVLNSAKKLVNDAEEKLITDEHVRNWVHELNDAIYQADDLVDTADTEALRPKVECDQSGSTIAIITVFKKSKSRFDEMMKNEVTEVLLRLTSLLDQGLERPLASQMPLLICPLADESSVFGRSGDKEAIVTLLQSGGDSEENISVIPIVGMGGIGKTTLAQLVYNDIRVIEHFDLRAWVTVSDDFNIDRITKEILEKVTLEDCRIGNSFGLLEKLKEALRGRRFLLVHDDVWNKNYHLWDILKSSFQSGAHGSKIVVTTRNMDVASIMAMGNASYKLNLLWPEDSWELFAKHAFKSSEDLHAHQDLQRIGMEIVRKCKGLPLAIRSLGGLLRCERNPIKWINILKSDVWNELYRREDNNILPALWLSYRHMPEHLKRCFSYCSIFPKDYKFEKQRIIWLWMAEGFLSSDEREKTMEELGEDYVEDLLSMSLFHEVDKNKSIFLMHDLIHDLAKFVSHEFCFSMDENSELHNLTHRTRYLSYSYVPATIDGICIPKGLRTFIQSKEIYEGFAPLRLYKEPAHVKHESLLSSAKFLRVLCLRRFPIEELPSSIGNLIHLRYLDLSCCLITELPDSICSLYNLQTLLLSHCTSLTALPKNMERLTKLRHLDIERVNLNEMTFQIKNMKSLQTLSKIVISNKDSRCKINELKGVQPLQGRLEIAGIDNVANAEEALEAGLKDKKGLRKLSLIWNFNVGANSLENEREVLDSLQPHINVRELEIKCYRGREFSGWIGRDYFDSIELIRLENCKRCSSLPPLGQLPRLKNLLISGFDSLSAIGDEFYGITSTPFRCLESLRISKMDLWKEWSFDGEGRVVFPRLDHLTLEKCPKLMVSFPNAQQSFTHFPSLDSMEVKNCSDTSLNSLLELVRHSKLKSLEIQSLENENLEDVSFPNQYVPIPIPTTQAEFNDILSSPPGLIEVEINRLSNLNGHIFQQLTSLDCLTISGWKGDSFPGHDILLPLSLTQINIWGSNKLEALNGKAFQQLTSLKTLTIQDCPQFQGLPKGMPDSISYLDIQR